MSKENKIGVYICTGCAIGDAIDSDVLRNICEEESDVIFCKSDPFLCRSESCQEIEESIIHPGLDKLVIGACSPRVKRNEFSFGSVFAERVNLREQVAWSHIPGEQETQILAEDLMKMGIARARTSEVPEALIHPDLTTDILILGGGITGISAAIDCAKAGYTVFLVEKEEKLGGKASVLYKQVPLKAPYRELADPVIQQKMAEVEDASNIQIFTSTTISQVSGQPGEFIAELISKDTPRTIKAASIIMATGWEPYDANRIGEYGYSEIPDVISSFDLETMVDGKTIVRPSDGKPAKRILFVQCAGSRDTSHLPYCSTYCCGTSLKQARYFREMNPDSQVFIIYKDIRAFGNIEHFYNEVQKDSHIFMTKGIVSSISLSGSDLIVEVKESLLEEIIHLKVDLVVLATGMVPNNTEVLNLNYRLGKGLPGLKYDFPDSHFICFPYETRRTGIYTAGNLRNPGYISMCLEDAAGAAMKAIQCAELMKQGKAVHPRSGDDSFPDLYMPRCTECKRCTEECPFGAYDETEKGTPLPNTNRCRRCAICLGSCPERIINFQNYSIPSISSMIRAVSFGDAGDKTRILAFVCENDAYPAFDMAGIQRLCYRANIRIIPVRCIGSVNRVWISDALSAGYDGILLVGCKPGDDYQCHYIQGSELTETRGENIRETLETMMLEKGRVRTEFLEINEYYRIPEIVEGYIHEIEKIGMNPFRGI